MEYKVYKDKDDYLRSLFTDKMRLNSGFAVKYEGFGAFDTIEFEAYNEGVSIPSCKNLIIHEIGNCYSLNNSSDSTAYADVVKYIPLYLGASNYIYVNCTTVDVGLRLSTYHSTRLRKVDLYGRVVVLNNYFACGLNKLSEVHIPELCKVIGDYAFAKCNKLTEVNINDLVNLEIVGEHSFEGTYIRKVILHKCREIGDYAFSGVRALEEVWLPDGLIKLGEGCFKDCNNLRKIRIPSTVQSIPKEFLNCGIFQEIKIPEGVKKIGSYAFSTLTARKLVIPQSVECMMRYSLRYSRIRQCFIPEGLYEAIEKQYGDVKEYTGLREGELIKY